MNNEERINRINELLNLIQPLSYEIIHLDGTLSSKKEKFFTTFDENDRIEINGLEELLKEKNSILTKLFGELQSLKCRYIVQYAGFAEDIYQGKLWEPITEELLLKTDCQIDTLNVDGWKPYSENIIVKELLVEIHTFLYNHRYTNFRIKNVRRINIR